MEEDKKIKRSGKNLIKTGKLECKEINSKYKHYISLTEEQYKEYLSLKHNSVSKDKVKEIVSQMQRCEQTATELIEERIVIADSDSLNFGRKQAHNHDIELIKHSLLEGDE